MSREEQDQFLDISAQTMAEDRENFSDKAISHAVNPRNVGNLEGADAFASVTGPCGGTMEMWLKVDDGRITSATFWTDGCAPSIACGSMITEMAKGRTLAEALGIWGVDVLEALGGLPTAHVHCSALASKTLMEAVLRYIRFHKGKYVRFPKTMQEEMRR